MVRPSGDTSICIHVTSSVVNSIVSAVFNVKPQMAAPLPPAVPGPQMTQMTQMGRTGPQMTQMTRMGLTLHPDKTRVVHAGKEWVNFLGYRFRRRPSGRVALDIAPKAMMWIGDKLRKITRRTFLSLDELISELNGYIRGAGQYFRLAEARRVWNLDQFVLKRIARWARHKHVQRLPEWSLARGTLMYREHGLASWWRQRQPTRGSAWARS